MKRLLLILGLLPAVAGAHVGSPNVFFEGLAGSYPLRVIVRPPAALPGFVQVDVRVADATNVAVRPVLWEAGAGAAADPVPATAVSGETNLFNAGVWLLFSGSYSFHVTVEGPRGSGTVVVPLNSAATRPPVMPRATGVVLIALGVILFAGAVWWCGAAARDGARVPGVATTAHDSSRGRRTALVAVMVFAGAIYAGTVRWQAMDREFRNNALAKPVPVTAITRTNGTLRLLQLTPPPDAAGMPGWDTLVADHGKLMHLFLVREPDFNAFAHLHPVRRDARTFENVLPPLPAGEYRLYAEVTQDNGLSQTLTATVALPVVPGGVLQKPGSTNMLNEVVCLSPPVIAGSAPQPYALDADDSWHTSAGPASGGRGRVSALMGGLNMAFQNTGDLIENRETSLRFTVIDPGGKPRPLQPYMGMLGHAVVRRADGSVFTHLHPVGTISMAAQALFARGDGPAAQPASGTNEPGIAAGQTGHEVAFPYAFPRPGAYRLWVQVRIEGRVLTGVFDLEVKPARGRG